MPSVCDCPFCGQPAAIPEDLDSETAVQCPHCQYEFPGDRALMYAVEAPPEHVAELPPALIPILASEAGAVAAPPSSEGQSPAGEKGDDGPGQALCVAEEINAAPTADAAADHPEPEVEPSPIAPTPAGETEKATEPSQPADEGSDVAAALPGGREGESPGEPSGQLVPGLEPERPEAETSPHEALGAPMTAAESSLASETLAAGPTETAAPAGASASDSAGAAVASAPSPEKPPTESLPSSERPWPAWQERRRRNPVRTAVGVVISGLLGLAVPYGAWLGLSKLGVVGRPRPPAATRNHAPADARLANPDSTMVPPPQPTESDEWPGLDENRFAVDPKEAKKQEKPSGRNKTGK